LATISLYTTASEGEKRIPLDTPKTGVLSVFSIPHIIMEKIRLPINAICFLNFTSKKRKKMLNYARFFGNYARNPGQDLPSGVDR
jgi:hypothetical protein